MNFSETNDPIYKKKSLHSNFVMLYNILKFQPDRIMGSALNPWLLLSPTTTMTTTTPDDMGWNLSSWQSKLLPGTKIEWSVITTQSFNNYHWIENIVSLFLVIDEINWGKSDYSGKQIFCFFLCFLSKLAVIRFSNIYSCMQIS